MKCHKRNCPNLFVTATTHLLNSCWFKRNWGQGQFLPKLKSMVLLLSTGIMKQTVFIQIWLGQKCFLETKQFDSVEQGMLAFRAKGVGNNDVFDKVMGYKKIYNMTQETNSLIWPGSYLSLVKFTYNCLYYLNFSKFQQNPELLDNLLKTKGRFAECNTGRGSIWNVGIVDKNDGFNDSANWLAPNSDGGFAHDITTRHAVSCAGSGN